jgi:8-oxo-dGTP pyrophosphatase MutT (NUDIX family)
MTEYLKLSDTDAPTRIASCAIFWDHHKRIGLQLRDAFDHTPAPGQWGTFGGQIEGSETPIETAIRELAEEIGVQLTKNDLIPHAIAASPRGVRLYSHICTRTIAAEDITLREGAGFAFLTRTQIATLPVLPAVQTLLHHFFENHPQIG